MLADPLSSYTSGTTVAVTGVSPLYKRALERIATQAGLCPSSIIAVRLAAAAERLLSPLLGRTSEIS